MLCGFFEAVSTLEEDEDDYYLFFFINCLKLEVVLKWFPNFIMRIFQGSLDFGRRRVLEVSG